MNWDEETAQEHWDLVIEVVWPHEPADVLAVATAWCGRREPDVQTVGLNLLGEFGANEPAARDQLLGVGLVLLHSADCDVRWSVARALGSNTPDRRVTRCCLI